MKWLRCFILISILSGCTASPEEDHRTVTPALPNHLQPYPSPERQHISLTKEGITLGRHLFYDPALSKDSTISCATCHHQDKAFSDGTKDSPHGISGLPQHRTAPPLFNLAWHDGYFRDGGATTLASQANGPITHPDELAADWTVILQRLNNNATYKKLLHGKKRYKAGTVLRALAQFQLTFISGSSPYDDYVKKENHSFNEQVFTGMKLVKEHCSSCHTPHHFSDFQYHNNGLDSTFDYPPEDPRLGRYRITGDTSDMGKYKTPSLRNIALTSPYMHDGRFNTLEEVLTHYSKGVKDSPQTSALLYKNDKPGFNFSSTEKKAIIAFLHTLTDTNFVKDTTLSNPWVK